jgi:hypothetical protein
MTHFSLRARLLASYLLLLAIALGMMAGALSLLLSGRPAPPQPIYRQLALVVQRNLNRALLPLGVDPDPQRITAQLTEFGDTFGVRVLVVNVTTGLVYFDSQGTLSSGDTLQITLEPTYSIASFQQAAQALLRRIETVFGSFEDPPGKEWLFTGLVNLRPALEGMGLLFADPRPQQSLQQVLADFGAVVRPAGTGGLHRLLSPSGWRSSSAAASRACCKPSPGQPAPSPRAPTSASRSAPAGSALGGRGVQPHERRGARQPGSPARLYGERLTT